MSKSLKKRVERLEKETGKDRGAPVIIVKPGETEEEAWQRHLAKYPEHEKAKNKIFIFSSEGRHQDKQEVLPSPAQPKKPISILY